MRDLAAVPLVLILSAAAISCGVKQEVMGQYFLKSGNFEQGLDNFREALKEDPGDPAANYYMGRFLLAEEQPDKAVGHFSRAAGSRPDNADYRFWLGVAHGESGDEASERRDYLAALGLDAGHLPARTYLAHLQLKAGENEKALANYNKVLEKWPYSPQALYNRALILGRLERVPEEKTAWKLYLAAWPEGPLARLAASHLNSLGDFSYRNHVLGKRTVTLEKLKFNPLGGRLEDNKSASLDLVGEIMERSPALTLYVTAYQMNNESLARDRAMSVKNYLTERFRVGPDRIRTSWFADPEKIEVGGRTFEELESVNLFAIGRGQK